MFVFKRVHVGPSRCWRPSAGKANNEASPPRISRFLSCGFFLAPPGVGPGPLAPDVTHRELTRFNYYVVAPAGWGPRIRSAKWSDLATMPWIVTPVDSVHHRLLKGTLDPMGLMPRGVAQVDQEA